MAQYINLYDPDLQRKRDWLALHVVAGGTLALVVIVGALGFVARGELPTLMAQAANSEKQLKAVRDQITALGQKSAQLKPNAQLEQSLTHQRALLEVRQDILTTLRQSLGPEAELFSAFLRGLSTQSVPGLWLTAFSVDAAKGAMEIRGSTLDPSLLPEYIRRLNSEKAFRGRSFAALKLDKAKPESAAQPQSGGAAPSTVRSRPHHDFMLIPARESESTRAAQSGQSAGGSS